MIRRWLLWLRCWALGHDDGKAYRTGTGVDRRTYGYESHCGFCDTPIIWVGTWETRPSKS